MSKRLLELAAVRFETIEVAGEKLRVREPSALELMERRQRQFLMVEDPENPDKPNRVQMPDATERGLAFLIANCVTNEKGEPCWTEAEAYTIATGRQEVALPIINAVTGFLALEKKASTPPSDSGTA